jgi:hypothetical protein
MLWLSSLSRRCPRMTAIATAILSDKLKAQSACHGSCFDQFHRHRIAEPVGD